MKLCVTNTALLCRAAHSSSPEALLHKILHNGLGNAHMLIFF